jgi:hypothetical protein
MNPSAVAVLRSVCIKPMANQRHFVPSGTVRFLARTCSAAELAIPDNGEDAIGDLGSSQPVLRYPQAPRHPTRIRPA